MEKKIVICFLALFLFGFTLADDLNLSANESVNNTNTVNITDLVNLINVSVGIIEIRNFFPTSVKPGDVQLNINIKNIGDKELKDVGAFISGNGFSSYEVVSIDSLIPGEKSYIIVNGNFKKSGDINLTIKINQEIFYRIVSVLNDSENIIIINKEFEENVTGQYNFLKNNYKILESSLQIKKDEGYDVSRVNLADLKVLIRDAQANILSGNFQQAKIKIDLANDEYETLNYRLENSEKISLASKLKENAVLFSTLAGAIITFFTLYELLRKKNEGLKETIKHLKYKEKVENS
jgi:hypothetical protein